MEDYKRKLIMEAFEMLDDEGREEANGDGRGTLQGRTREGGFIMKTIEVELTFEELDMLIASMEAINNNLHMHEKVVSDRFEVYDKLLSRLQTIDNAHTVMLTAAMHDDNPNPWHEAFIEAGKDEQQQSAGEASA